MHSRVLMLLVALSAVATQGPAAAESESHPVVWDAPVPCLTVCPYWLGSGPVSEDDFDACKKDPFAPPGSWDDIRVTVPPDAPGTAYQLMTVEMEPFIDYDLFICLVHEPGTANERYELHPPGLIVSPDECVIGCREQWHVPTKGGDVWVLRAYNFSDVRPALGSYRFRQFGGN